MNKIAAPPAPDHDAAWAAYAAEAKDRREARAWNPEGGTSHIPYNWCTIARQHGRMAAHGVTSRGSLETILAAWCKIMPGLRGDSVAFLVWLFEQAEKHELQLCDVAAYRVRRAVWPLFKLRAARTRIMAAAEQANRDDGRASSGPLFPAEVEAVVALVCEQATYVPRRR